MALIPHCKDLGKNYLGYNIKAINWLEKGMGKGKRRRDFFHSSHKKVVKEGQWKSGLEIGNWLPSLPKQKVLGQLSLISVLKNTGLLRMGSRLANTLIPLLLGVVEQNLRQPEYLLVYDICQTHAHTHTHILFFMCSDMGKNAGNHCL